MVFLGSSRRETAKNAIKKNRWEKTKRKKFFFSTFRPKVFDMDFPQKVFHGVFELPLLRNAQKRHLFLKNLKKETHKNAHRFGGVFLWRFWTPCKGTPKNATNRSPNKTALYSLFKSSVFSRCFEMVFDMAFF
jgi:hypothetical protein